MTDCWICPDVVESDDAATVHIECADKAARLPDYEAAVEALEGLLKFWNWYTDDRSSNGTHAEFEAWSDEKVPLIEVTEWVAEQAREALRRLREGKAARV